MQNTDIGSASRFSILNLWQPKRLSIQVIYRIRSGISETLSLFISHGNPFTDSNLEIYPGKICTRWDRDLARVEQATLHESWFSTGN
jgi:hypothetical protein